MSKLTLTVYLLDEGHSYCDLSGGLVLTRTAVKGCRTRWGVEDAGGQIVVGDGHPSASYCDAYMESLAEAERIAKEPTPMDTEKGRA